MMETNKVKNILKHKILERREEAGLGLIAVEFNPKQSYPMTEEEKEKDRRRKEINKRSSEKCRRRQREEYEKNKEELQQLKHKNECLMAVVRSTEEEKTQMLTRLRGIVPEEEIHGALRGVYCNTDTEDEAAQNSDSACTIEDHETFTNSYLGLLEDHSVSDTSSSGYNSDMNTESVVELSTAESADVASEILIHFQELPEGMSSASKKGPALDESDFISTSYYLSSDISDSDNKHIYVLAF